MEGLKLLQDAAGNLEAGRAERQAEAKFEAIGSSSQAQAYECQMQNL